MRTTSFLRWTMLFIHLSLGSLIFAQVVPVGNGSYTLTFPGVDAAGRNSYPSGTPYITGDALGQPIPTNDWWSAKVKNPHADNLFNYPFTLKTVNEGLVVSYIPWGPIDNILPVIVGVSSLNAAAANVSNHSDWMVSMQWSNAAHQFEATAGIGMPFLYFQKASSDVASVTVNQGNVTINNEILLVEDARNGADFALYAPSGSSWTQQGNQYTSTLNGQNYWSLAFIPSNATNPMAGALAFAPYAFVFPTNTLTNWNYNQQTSTVTTNFTVEVEVKEGVDSTLLMGLLPHQWNNLAQPLTFSSHIYPSVRGELRMAATNSFSVANTFHGILPTLPNLSYYSTAYSPVAMNTKISLLENDALNPWTDSYNEGQEMNRLIQTARVAQLNNDSLAFLSLKATVKERLEDWLKVQANEVAFLFYYNQTWTAMLGYPAGHGQDNNINDHHFHWGYFIHAAAFMEQFEPGWATQWGPMVDLLVRDAASNSRTDNLFPYLRNFSPYAGHCWANGFASFPQGNDQESTSESMQFNSSLIHWGSVTGNNAIRDLGIYLYTTEQTAIEEYWFDQYNRNFGPNQNYRLVSRVWGNSYDNGTFWTADIAASYGIELYPIHGGSFYLGHDTNYVKELWTEMTQNTGILTNDPNVNLWHDEYWKYLSFVDPEAALALYDSYPNRSLKFGVTDVQTYHWLHGMNVLGRINTQVTANHPLAVVFIKDGDTTYVAQNYGNTPLLVQFSDGFNFTVPPRSLATSKDISLAADLSSSFLAAYPGGSVDLTLNILLGNASMVEFYDGDSLMGSLAQAPFVFTAQQLQVGKHAFYAKVYDGNAYVISNIVEVVVGEQLPYNGTAALIPGTIESGHYDLFEGGNASAISYHDMNVLNEGNFRTDEYVDAFTTTGEGDAVGWINNGEWLEYTVDVQQAGFYTLNVRYASGNSQGGGPFALYSDEQYVATASGLGSTGGWNSWSNYSLNGVPMKSGKQILRLQFLGGEFNLGKLNFTLDSALNYSQPLAHAGSNQLITLPASTAIVDGNGSVDPSGGNLSFSWTQIYGPSNIQWSSTSVAMPQLSNLQEGIYLLELEVDNGSYSDRDEVYVIVSTTGNVAPKVSIRSPLDQSVFYENEQVLIEALASDLNDSVVSVSFYVDGFWLGTDTQFPYQWTWTPVLSGNYDLVALALDGLGDSTYSSITHCSVIPAPDCEQSSWNGDFNYRFSPDQNNPTITFIPSQAGVGVPTCILYYGTDPGNMPGYNVTPNVPYSINASSGTRIYFYYTYSFPGAGERNNSANKDTYVVGTCQNISVHDYDLLQLQVYPNPVQDFLHLEWVGESGYLEVYQTNGVRMDSRATNGQQLRYDMQAFPVGLYFFKLQVGEELMVFKVLKQ